MAVVQRGGVVPAGTYTRVGAVAAPPLEVAEVLEQALQLVLGHARPHPPHHLRQRRGVKSESTWLRRLYEPQSVEVINERLRRPESSEPTSLRGSRVWLVE
jgi:hypothetical protein